LPSFFRVQIFCAAKNASPPYIFAAPPCLPGRPGSRGAPRKTEALSAPAPDFRYTAPDFRHTAPDFRHTAPVPAVPERRPRARRLRALFKLSGRKRAPFGERLKKIFGRRPPDRALYNAIFTNKSANDCLKRPKQQYVVFVGFREGNLDFLAKNIYNLVESGVKWVKVVIFLQVL
jgi:hypothetical protein